jgi:hypothetical protein
MAGIGACLQITIFVVGMTLVIFDEVERFATMHIGSQILENYSMDPVAHASVALMAKPAVPEAPLWALIAATQLPDLLFFAFEAAGLEQQAETRINFHQGLIYLSQPTMHLSHGLLMTLV